jgi:hypothetical protein
MGKIFVVLLLAISCCGGLAKAETWDVASPDQGQTFAFGSERSRQWFGQGRHLALAMHFTNDPYVDLINTRRYDDFIFDFPKLTLGQDGKTFFYHPTKNQAIPVAVKRGLWGIYLLPTSYLAIRKLHGLVTVNLIVSDSPNSASEGD